VTNARRRGILRDALLIAGDSSKMAHKFHILLLNGPNLNLLGTREPDKYGHTTLAQIVGDLTQQADQHHVKLNHLQSNAEFQLIDRIHEARGNVDYISQMCMHASRSDITPIFPMYLPASSVDLALMDTLGLYKRQ